MARRKATKQSPLLAPDPVDGESSHEADAQHAGMATEQYNEAIRLTCAVRDVIDWPVTMVQAFEIARALVRVGMSPSERQHIRTQLELQATERETLRRTEQRRVAQNAGK